MWERIAALDDLTSSSRQLLGFVTQNPGGVMAAERLSMRKTKEVLRQLFTINRPDLPPRLRKCLATTNLIDSTHSGLRQRTRRITNWKNGAMVPRWSAAAFLATEKNYRRIIGHEHLWILKAHLDEPQETIAEVSMAG